MSERAKCPYCHKELYKINLKDHKEECSKNPHLKGISGWLIILVINLYIGILLYLFYTISLSFLNVIPLIFTIYVIILLHAKRKKFKNMAIIWLWLPVGFIVFNLIIDIFLLTQEEFSQVYDIADFTTYIVRIIIFTIIWTQYLRVSKRVKNTFVN